MKFPINVGLLKICAPEDGKMFGKYYVNHLITDMYIDKNGGTNHTCGSCWYHTFKDAVRAAVLFNHGEDSIAVRLVEAIDDEELLYAAITGRESGVVFSVRILTSQDPPQIEMDIKSRLDGLEFQIDAAEDVEIPSNYKWDGSFFNTEVSE